MYLLNCDLKTEIDQLKSSEMKLSSNFERLKEEYYILTQDIEKSTYIKEAEGVMGQLEEILTEKESNLMKILTKTNSSFTLSFMKKNKVHKYNYMCIYT